MGAWVAYGLGTANENLPTFTVMISRGTGRLAPSRSTTAFWGSGMLPSRYQGVKPAPGGARALPR